MKFDSAGACNVLAPLAADLAPAIVVVGGERGFFKCVRRRPAGLKGFLGRFLPRLGPLASEPTVFFPVSGLQNPPGAIAPPPSQLAQP
jgi:hypothetical protein